MEKSKLWGVMRQLDEAKLGEFRRHYAHFHRVLGPLLVELGEQPGTVWLEGAERHVLTGEGEENRYARALYPVRDLEPYRERLEELEKVQAAGVELLGGGESPKGLLPPQGRRGRAPCAPQPPPQLRPHGLEPRRGRRAARRTARSH